MTEQQLTDSSTAGQHASCVDDQLQNVLEIKRLTRAVLDLVASTPCDHAALVASIKDMEARVQHVQQQWPEVDKLIATVAAAAAAAGSQGMDQGRRAAADQASQAMHMLQEWYCSSRQVPCAVPLSQQPHCTPAVIAPDVLQGVLQRVRQLLPAPLALGEVRTLNKFAKGPKEVHLVCPGVFVAAVALAAPGSPEPVHVCVDAPPAAGQQPSPWAVPRQQVYKRVSSLAATALSYYLQQAAAGAAVVNPSSHMPAASREGSAPAAPQAAAPPQAAAAAAAAPRATPPPDRGRGGSPAGAAQGAPGAAAAGWALECLLLWLAGYQDLFSRPCHVSGKVVCWEPASLMPLVPVVRPFKLTLAELQAAARDPSKRLAYHAHLAPKHLLQLDTPATAQHVQPGTLVTPTGDMGDLGSTLAAGGVWQEEQLKACLSAAGLLPKAASKDDQQAGYAAAPQQGGAGSHLEEEDDLWEVVDRVAVVVPPPAPPPPIPAHPAAAAAAAAAAAGGGGAGRPTQPSSARDPSEAAAGNQGPAGDAAALTAQAGVGDKVDTPAGMSPDDFNLLDGAAAMGGAGMMGLGTVVSPPEQQQQQYTGSTLPQQQLDYLMPPQQIVHQQPQQQQDFLVDLTATGSEPLPAAGVMQHPQHIAQQHMLLPQQQQPAAGNAYQQGQQVPYQYQPQP